MASVSYSTQKSRNYILADGTMEKNNNRVGKELVMVWDEAISEHRIATEQEKSSPHIGKICAIKWGSYLNKNADSMDRPSCLIDLRTLKQATILPIHAISVHPTSTTQTGINHLRQANPEPMLGTAEEEDIDTWAKYIMMEHERTYEHTNGCLLYTSPSPRAS